MNFDRLRFVAERAELGEQREAILAVTIPERPGSFRDVLRAARQAQRHRVQLSLRRSEGRARLRRRRGRRPRTRPTTLLTALQRAAHRGATTCPTTRWRSCTCATWSAATRRRAEHEILYRFEFPERPGRADALPRQHERAAGTSACSTTATTAPTTAACWWACRCRPRTSANSARFLDRLGYDYVDETGNPAYRMFLGR